MELSLVKREFLGVEDVWDMDFSKPKIDRELTKLFSSKHRGSVRISMGLFLTDEEWEKIKEEDAKHPLP